MNVDPMTMVRARWALREAARNYLFDPNVSLIDFGNPEHDGEIAQGELAIRIHVRKKLSGMALETAVAAGYTRPIPPSIGGFPTDVPEGNYRPHFWPWRGGRRPPRPANPRTTRTDPMRGGISASDEYHNAAGTLGARVLDRTTGAAMILSNWHVLVASWGARPGQRIFQPGRLDGGTDADSVATLTRDAMSSNLDAAVATLDGSRGLINDQLDLGPVTGVGRAELGMELMKSGRTSGTTHAVVTAVEGIARMTYGYVERIIRNVVTLDPLNAGQVSEAGDSGSLWLDAATTRAIGLHFAGSSFPERGLALDIQAVLDALSVDLDIPAASPHPPGPRAPHSQPARLSAGAGQRAPQLSSLRRR